MSATSGSRKRPGGTGVATTKRRQYAQRMPTEKRREQLLDAARFVALTDGMRDVTMERIAREAGVTKPVVYSVFGNAETMLEALTKREYASAHTQVQTALPTEIDELDPVAVAAAGVGAFMRAVRENVDTWRFLALAEQLPEGPRRRYFEARDDLVKQVTALMEWGLAQRSSGPLDAELAARLLFVGLDAAVRLVLADPQTYTEERIVPFASELIRAIQEG